MQTLMAPDSVETLRALEADVTAAMALDQTFAAGGACGKLGVNGTRSY